MPDAELEPPFAAYEGEEAFLFASYSHSDAAAVFPELARLHGLGYRIWFDEGIDPGNEWPSEIANALKNCAQFLVFISPNAVASRNVANEIQLALRRNKPFLAIYLVDTKLPDGLDLNIGTFQHVMKYRMSPDNYDRKMAKSLLASTLAGAADLPAESKPEPAAEEAIDLQPSPLTPKAAAPAPKPSSARWATAAVAGALLVAGAWYAASHSSSSPRAPANSGSLETTRPQPFADFIGKWSLLRDGSAETATSFFTNNTGVVTTDTVVTSADILEFGQSRDGQLVVASVVSRIRTSFTGPNGLNGSTEETYPPGEFHQASQSLGGGRPQGFDERDETTYKAVFVPEKNIVLVTRHNHPADPSHRNRDTRNRLLS